MSKHIVLATALGCFLVSSGTGFAQQSPAPAAPTAQLPQAPETEDPNEVICKSGEPIVGSRFAGPRICHTRKE